MPIDAINSSVLQAIISICVNKGKEIIIQLGIDPRATSIALKSRALKLLIDSRHAEILAHTEKANTSVTVRTGFSVQSCNLCES